MSPVPAYVRLQLLLMIFNVPAFARLNRHNHHHHSDGHKKHNDHIDKNNKFDFYVLSMSYQPEFCDSHQFDSFVGCEKPNDYWKSSLTIHGLWPQRSDGTWPSSCSNEAFSMDVVNEVGLDRFMQNWPNTKASPDDRRAYTGFWAHEWTKHGTCSGLTQKQYFTTAMDHFLATPSLVRERYGSTVTKSELTKAYDSNDPTTSVTLICSGKYLSEVRICLQKNEKDGTATERMKCTESVTKEGNCPDELTIPKFYSDKDTKVIAEYE